MNKIKWMDRIKMCKSKHQKSVESFMKQAGQEVPDLPTVPDPETCKLRAKLILEEALETIEALGVKVQVNHNLLENSEKVSPWEFHTVSEPDIAEVLDGCADLSVVTIGTLSAFGMPDLPVLNMVDQSNLEKFEEGSYRREDGKWMKPPTWKAPDFMYLWKYFLGETSD